jgi:hypothetical protein
VLVTLYHYRQVIRYEGPRGSPGMPEMLSPGAALIGAGLGKHVALVRSRCLWILKLLAGRVEGRCIAPHASFSDPTGGPR